MSGLVVPSLAKEPEAVFIHGPCSCLYNYSAHRVGALDVGLIAALNYNCQIIVCFSLKESHMNKKPAIAFLLSTAFVFVAVLALVFWPSQSGAPVARGKSPAAPITQEMTPEQTLAQDLALSDTTVQGYTLGSRSEVMGIQPVGMQFTPAAAACATANCQQVDIYNYDTNVTITALVNVDSREVLDVLYQPNIRAGGSSRIKERSIEIMYADERIPELLGRPITREEIMPMDATMNNTACGSTHQCVGTTFFAANNRDILWVLVDMTEERVVGYDWTHNDPNSSEIAAAYENPIMGCPPPGTVTNRDGWTLAYGTTGSDGFRVYDAYYNGRLILKSAKLAEWHADYGSSGYVDATGCSPVGGFPIYPYGDTVVNNLMDGPDIIGFELVQDFRMGNWGSSCNYRYEQHIQFYADGRFRVSGLAYGKGCGTNSMYRPVIRIDVAVDGDDNDQVGLWDGINWVDQGTEFYRTPYAGPNGPHVYNDDGAVARVYDTGTGNGFYIVPDEGQWGTNSRGDDPFLYVTQHKPSEGDTDLGAIGQCCLDDHQQGPHNFVNGEAIDDRNLVMWYVPQMLTDVTVGNYYCWTVSVTPTVQTYPCWGGPMFVPMSNVSNIAPATASSLNYVNVDGLSTQVQVPSGAVSQDTSLVYYEMSLGHAAPASFSFAGRAFGMDAYQGGAAIPNFNFSQPIDVIIEYDDIELGGLDENSLILMYWDGVEWVDVATTCTPTGTYTRDTVNNTVSISVCHLTEFSLFGQFINHTYFPLISKE